MSAFGGKADIAQGCCNVRFRPKAETGNVPLVNPAAPRQITHSPVGGTG